MANFLRFALLFGAVTAWAQPRPLVPAPRKVSYSTGTLAVCRLPISLPVTANAADRDAARRWADALLASCGDRPAVRTEAQAPAASVRFERTNPVDQPLPVPDEPAGPGTRESYTLSVGPAGVTVKSPSSAGLYYAAATLGQLLEAGVLPRVEIEDWPAYRYRALMFDISHGPVPTEAELRSQIDFLARFKTNQYYLYFESNVELDGYPLLSQIPGLTRAQIAGLIEYARLRHIDIVPCVELYGHLHDTLRTETYAPLGALPHGGELNPLDAKARALQEDWLRQFAALFPSPFLHLGYDEPWELERSRLAEHPETHYLANLQHLANLTIQLGKRPLFWADVTEGAYLFERYPQLFTSLPKGLTAVPWFYDRMKDYSPLTEPFARNKVPFFVAPGVFNYGETYPDYGITFENINGMAATGRRFGALGFINTVWSDSAQMIHRQALPAFAFGAAAAWEDQPVDAATFFARYTAVTYPAPVRADLTGALAALRDAQTHLAAAIGRETMFRIWDDPLEPHILKTVTPHSADLRQARLAAERAQVDLLHARELAPTAEILPDLLLGARLIDYAAQRYLYALEIVETFHKLPPNPTDADIDFFWSRQIAARNHSRVGDLLDQSGVLAREYEEAWRAGYLPYRLDTALGRFRGEFDYWRTLQSRLRIVLRRARSERRFPTLEEIRRGQ